MHFPLQVKPADSETRPGTVFYLFRFSALLSMCRYVKLKSDIASVRAMVNVWNVRRDCKFVVPQPFALSTALICAARLVIRDAARARNTIIVW